MSDSQLLFIVNTVLQHGPDYSVNIPGSGQRVTTTLESIQPDGRCICRTVSGNSFEATMEEFIALMRTSLEQSVDDASAGMPDESTGVPEVMDRLRL